MKNSSTGVIPKQICLHFTLHVKSWIDLFNLAFDKPNFLDLVTSSLYINILIVVVNSYLTEIVFSYINRSIKSD